MSVLVAQEESDWTAGLGRFVTSEVWRVASLGGNRVERRLLARSDGFRKEKPSGAPEYTPLAFRRTGNRIEFAFDHSVWPTSTFRSRGAAQIQIDPPALLGKSTTDFQLVVHCRGITRSWDPLSLSARVDWEPGTRNGGCEHYRYLELPDVDLPDEFLTTSWQTARLGSCAADVSGQHGHGFTIFGTNNGPNDASFRVVLSGITLFVEVTDDHFVGPSGNWVNDDHVELWLAPHPYLPMTAYSDDPDPPKQWAIRIADGQVFPGFGRPTEMPEAQVVRVDAHTARLRILIPSLAPAPGSKPEEEARAQAITVVYSDSDNGKTQKSLIATSALAYGRTLSLGTVDAVSPARATCAVKDAELQATTTRASPMSPLVSN